MMIWLVPMNASSKVAVAGPPLSDSDLIHTHNEVYFFVHFSLVYMILHGLALLIRVQFVFEVLVM